MNLAETFLEQKINERTANGLLRKLTTEKLPIDFCSNDYLGFAKSTELQQLIEKEGLNIKGYENGSGGSRLISGNTLYIEDTERLIADFHQAKAGLIYNSGYDANIGLLSSIPQRGDTIITDELIHASLIDGARLSYAERYKFKHNDLADLEKKLKIASGLIYVVVESIYSMDGDAARLKEINALCNRYGANLIVDEAHATGIFGNHGGGLVLALGLEKDVFARVITFGKAIGVHGAIILGSNKLRQFLINFSRSFIYTTAAPLHNIIAINCAYHLLAKENHQNLILHKINLYKDLMKRSSLNSILSDSAIQTILFGNNETARKAAHFLQEEGFDVKAILSPTVALGKERLRICLHSFNSDEEIISLVAAIKKIEK